MGKAQTFKQSPRTILCRAVAAHDMAVFSLSYCVRTGAINPFLASQSAVFSAFAAENYFKCIIQMERGEFPPIHYLDDLFYLTSEASQKVVRAYFENPHPQFLDQRRAVEKEPKQTLTIEDCLKMARNAFVEWRYTDFNHGNKNSGSIVHLVEIVEGLCIRIEEMDPRLKPYSRVNIVSYLDWLSKGGNGTHNAFTTWPKD